MKVLLIHAFLVGVSLERVWSQFSLCDDEYCLWTDGQEKMIENLQHAQSLCSGNKWLVEISNFKLNDLLRILIYQYYFTSSPVLLNIIKLNNSWMWNNMKKASVAFDYPSRNSACLTRNMTGDLIFVAENSTILHKFICMKTVSSVEECNKLKGWFYQSNCFVPKESATWLSSGFICNEFFNATLAVFHDIDMSTISNSWISSLFPYGNEMYWVGMSRKTLTWGHSGQAVTYNQNLIKFSDDEEFCRKVILNGDYSWQYTSCKGSFLIVCMSPVEMQCLQKTPSNETTYMNPYLAPMIAGWAVVGLLLVSLVVTVAVVLLKLLPLKISLHDETTEDLRLPQTFDNYTHINREAAALEDSRHAYTEIEM